MSSPTAEKISSIRAVRPVIPSVKLREFIRSASKLLTDGDFDFSHTQTEPLVYSADRLELTLFAMRAVASVRVNERLEKVQNYLRSEWHSVPKSVLVRPGVKQQVVQRRRNLLPTTLADIESNYVTDSTQLLFRASGIVDCTKSLAKHPGSELALVIDGGPVADVVSGQSETMWEAAKKPNAYTLLTTRVGRVEPAVQVKTDNPLEIPFAFVPFRGETDRDEYIEQLSAELPVYGLGLGSITHEQKLITP